MRGLRGFGRLAPLVAAVLLVSCNVGQAVSEESEPVRVPYIGTAGLPSSVVSNPAALQPYRCRVSQAATRDIGQCGPAHYQGQGFAVALPAACVDWLQNNWLPSAAPPDNSSDASVVIRDPDTGAVLAQEPRLMNVAWGLVMPGGQYGAPQWPLHVYFTYAGTGRLNGGRGWTYDTPRVPALSRYSVEIACVSDWDWENGGYLRSNTSGFITIP